MVNSEEIGDGSISYLKDGTPIFKLSSHPQNPIVKPQDLGLVWYEEGELRVGAVFNGGAEVFRGKVMLTPRCHKGYREGRFFDEKLGIERTCFENYISEVWVLESRDGLNFIPSGSGSVIKGDGSSHRDFIYGIEDIRITKCGGYYILIGCGKLKPPFKGENGDRIAIYTTEDFNTIRYHGIIRSFDSRNAVLFPEPITDKIYMLLRFHPNIHLVSLEAGLDQLLEPESERSSRFWDRVYERREENILLKAGELSHEREKIGPGAPPIKTEDGWLLIYHAVGEIGREMCEMYGLPGEIERGYSVCAALLDLNEPGKVLARTPHPIYIPSHPWELYGSREYPVDVPCVVFPMGAIVHKGKLLIYAGAGDKYVCLLTCDLRMLLDYLQLVAPPQPQP